MSLRNVIKSLAGMQDLLTGVGPVTQVRNEQSYTINRIDVPFAVTANADMQNLDPAEYTHARVYEPGTTRYTDYLYSASRSDGIASLVAAGSWIKVSPARITATTAQLADIGHAINTADKFVGKDVFNTTTGKPVYAVGAAAGSVWNDAVGVLAHTPV